MACMAVKKVLELYEKNQILEHVQEVGPYLAQRLDALKEKYDCIKERRGKGLIQGIELTGNPSGVVKKALEEGLIIITAKGNTIRFVPPLIIDKVHVDEMIEKLERALKV